MLYFCEELTKILIYLEGLMTHMGGPESLSVSVRLIVMIMLIMWVTTGKMMRTTMMMIMRIEHHSI